MKVRIDSVESDGFYRIPIKTEFVPFLRDNYSDIRVFDEGGKEVPYFIESEKPSAILKIFREYELTENERSDGRTVVTVHNKEGDTLSGIQLKIKNASVVKYAQLLGSDDKKNWFVVRENFLLDGLYKDQDVMVTKTIDFPPSDYQFLRFLIDDSTTAPVKILSAGYYDYNVEKGNYQEIPVNQISQVDSSDKMSYVHFNLGGRHFVDLMEFTIQGSPFFHRRTTLYEEKIEQIKKRAPEKRKYEVAVEIISSDRENIWRFESLPLDTAVLVIENNDNQPVKLSSIKCYQLVHYLHVYLNQGVDYEFYFNNPAADKPNYDLKYFKNQIPDNSPLIGTGEIEQNVEKDKKSPSSADKTWIWVILTVVFAFLFLMARRMLKEMSKSN